MSILKHFGSNRDVGMRDAILKHLTYHLQTFLTDLLKVEIFIKHKFIHTIFVLYSVTIHLHRVGLLGYVKFITFHYNNRLMCCIKVGNFAKM